MRDPAKRELPEGVLIEPLRGFVPFGGFCILFSDKAEKREESYGENNKVIKHTILIFNCMYAFVSRLCHTLSITWSA